MKAVPVAECRLCGIDVADDTICVECKNESGKRSVRQFFFSASLKMNLLLAAIIVLVFAVFVGCFQLALYLEAQNLNEAGLSAKDQRSLSAGTTLIEEQSGPHYDILKEKELVPIGSKSEYLNWMTKNTGEEIGFLEKRWDLSRVFIESGELDGDNLVRAFLRTPREHFVRSTNIKRAYDDTWLAIGYGATITDPDVVSMMTTSLEVKPDSKVLEIGTGSGYQSAFLSRLSNFVFTIEIITPLAIETNQLYKSLEDRYPMYRNIKRKLDDGFYGWEQYAPFDRIIITCAIDHVPPPLIKQLSPEGIIVAPLGPPGRQQIMKLQKKLDTDNKITITRRDVYNGTSVKFIPFTNRDGVSRYDKATGPDSE
jgi:protein-L-isoaspartate(D-aspartate) O-methyltransferase